MNPGTILNRSERGAPFERGPGRVEQQLTLLKGLRAVPPRVAQRYGVIPLRYEGERLIAGARDPRDLRALDALRRLGHHNVVMEPITEERYQQVMAQWYGPAGIVADFVARLPRMPSTEPTLRAGGKIEMSPAPRFLDLTLKAAVAEGASDVHIEPDPNHPRVRFRVDGILSDRVSPPRWLADRVIGRIKAMAGLALGECFFAQEGKIAFRTPQGSVSIRVSILPSDRGECAVLRLLTTAGAIPSLEALGMPDDVCRDLTQAVAAQEGLVVLAGPTGSGKTTTLHALLDAVYTGRRNVVSIEEPVEIVTDRIRQVPVRREVGLDFAGAMRVVLRQDPDVILVGETRDRETAQMVIQAALAGHLVLTTVHASSALQVFDRFTQLGGDRSLLAQTVRVTVSQRLLRKVCPHCAGTACFICEGSGLKGRIGVYEIVSMNVALSEAVRKEAPLRRLVETARASGFRSLRDRALDLVQSGATTTDAVDRVLDVEES